MWSLNKQFNQYGDTKRRQFRAELEKIAVTILGEDQDYATFVEDNFDHVDLSLDWSEALEDWRLKMSERYGGRAVMYDEASEIEYLTLKVQTREEELEQLKQDHGLTKLQRLVDKLRSKNKKVSLELRATNSELNELKSHSRKRENPPVIHRKIAVRKRKRGLLSIQQPTDYSALYRAKSNYDSSYDAREHYDVQEQQKSGTVITGLSGSGKTNLAKLSVDLMMAENLRVYVFDPSQAWRTSNLPKLSIVNERIIPVKESAVYDISLLHEQNQKEVVSWFAKLLFESAVKGDYNLPTVLVLEEAQLYMTNSFFRSKAGSELKRYITVGRNYDLHFLIISRRLATLSTDAVMTCGQRYHGYTDEIHDWRRAKNYLHDWSKQLGSLDTGEFLYKKRKHIGRIKTPLHMQTRIPQGLSWWEKVKPISF